MNGNNSVLVVDDDRDVVLGASLRLRAAGYRTDTAQNGREGLMKAINTRPGAIVLDVQMPVMDGLETLDQLQLDQRTRNIPIVMLSASLLDRQRALDAGARFFVEKPYDAPQLLKAVEVAIEEKSRE